MNGVTGRVDIKEALCIDCTRETVNGQVALKCQNDLAVIERMLVGARDLDFREPNPRYWSC